MPRRVQLDGAVHEFPDDATDDEIAAALGDSEPPRSDGTGLALAATRAAVPGVRQIVEEVATHPGIVSGATRAGHTAGGLGGILKAGPLGMDAGARYGGKVGHVAGTAAQRTAGVVARGLEKAAPYAQSLSTLAGAQGVLDLAQMAEPGRRDIGVLGVEIGSPRRSEQEQQDHPALINMLFRKLLALGK